MELPLQEPSLLSSLQDKGLTDVVLHALLVKDVPATREVLGSLPNVFSALCLNTRGLDAFVACKPFDRLFKARNIDILKTYIFLGSRYCICAAESHLSMLSPRNSSLT